MLLSLNSVDFEILWQISIFLYRKIVPFWYNKAVCDHILKEILSQESPKNKTISTKQIIYMWNCIIIVFKKVIQMWPCYTWLRNGNFCQVYQLLRLCNWVTYTRCKKMCNHTWRFEVKSNKCVNCRKVSYNSVLFIVVYTVELNEKIYECNIETI